MRIPKIPQGSSTSLGVLLLSSTFSRSLRQGRNFLVQPSSLLTPSLHSNSPHSRLQPRLLDSTGASASRSDPGRASDGARAPGVEGCAHLGGVDNKMGAASMLLQRPRAAECEPLTNKSVSVRRLLLGANGSGRHLDLLGRYVVHADAFEKHGNRAAQRDNHAKNIHTGADSERDAPLLRLRWSWPTPCRYKCL